MTFLKRFKTTEKHWQQRQGNRVRFERNEIDMTSLVRGETKA